MLIATHHKQLKPTATALFVFLVMFLSAYAHSNPVLNEAIKHSPPVCTESLMSFEKIYTDTHKQYLTYLLIDEIEQDMDIRKVLYQEGAFKSQQVFDEKLLTEISSVLSRKLNEEQKSRLRKIKKIILKHPLHVAQNEFDKLLKGFNNVQI
jgi:hypothetical protein